METIEQNGKPTDEIKKPFLLLTSNGKNGHYLLISMRKILERLLQETATTTFIFTVKKLGFCFNIKDEIKVEQNLDVIYHGKCPGDDCRDGYISETKRRIPETIKDHIKDTSSRVLKHSVESRHRIIIERNVTGISNGFRNNTIKRRTAKSLITKKRRRLLISKTNQNTPCLVS